VAPLIIEWARATRRESALRRRELAQRSSESARASRQLADHCRVWDKEVARAETNRRKLPEWPAWAPPDPDLIRTLVVLD
jgi:hypothetical protein